MKKKTTKTPPDAMPADVSHRKGWHKTKRVVDPTHVKVPTRRITINLDQDIIAIFKAETLRGGLPYQVAINQALRAGLGQAAGLRVQAPKTIPHHFGFKPGIDLDKLNQFADQLEVEAFADKYTGASK